MPCAVYVNIFEFVDLNFLMMLFDNILFLFTRILDTKLMANTTPCKVSCLKMSISVTYHLRFNKWSDRFDFYFQYCRSYCPVQC